MNVDEQSYREKVYRIVNEIPVGRVMTYGQIADILGEGYTARTIGYVMHAADTEMSRGKESSIHRARVQPDG